MTEDASETAQSGGAVDRRGVLKLMAVPGALSPLAYFSIDRRDQRWLPNWLEYAGSSRVQWAVSRGFDTRPTVADGNVYLRDDKTIYALAADDGTEQWAVDPADDEHAEYHVPPIAADGTVYVFRREGPLYALDAADGSVRWTADLDGDIASGPPTVAGETVYIGVDRMMYALDTADGSERWAVELPDPSGSPVVDDDTVYAGASQSVHALDTDDGTERWATTADDHFTGLSARVGDTLCAVAFDALYAFDATDGSRRWDLTLPTMFEYPVAVADGAIYASIHTGPLYAIDAADGEGRVLFQTQSGMSSPPTVADGTVYVGSNRGDGGHRLHAIDPGDGTERWSFPIDTDEVPTVVDGTVYVASDSLYALDT